MKRLMVCLQFLAIAACSGRADEAALPEPTACEVEGMRNCAMAGGLVIGGQPSEAALQELAGRGYRTVITTRGDGEVEWDERAAAEALGMEFVSIPMVHPVTGITDAQISALAEVFDRVDGPTLLHCGSGNRAAGLWGAWLAEREGVDPEVALELAARMGMTGVRPVVEQRLGVEGEGEEP
jgi:uncharacterized protein (TIGR01244 family)